MKLTENKQHFSLYKAASRGVEKRPGFVSKQSFNFASRYIPGREGFGSLRVFNFDTVEDGTGIPMHPHANFEILSVLLSGRMEHQDNLGNSLTLHANEVKLMSSGSGLLHGGICYDHTVFLQIWITPNQQNTPPLVSTRAFSPEARINAWQLQVSPLATDEVLTIKQRLWAYRGLFDAGKTFQFELPGTYRVFLMPMSGTLQLEGEELQTQDSAEFEMTDSFSFEVIEKADLWLMAEQISANA